MRAGEEMVDVAPTELAGVKMDDDAKCGFEDWTPQLTISTISVSSSSSLSTSAECKEVVISLARLLLDTDRGGSWGPT